MPPCVHRSSGTVTSMSLGLGMPPCAHRSSGTAINMSLGQQAVFGLDFMKYKKTVDKFLTFSYTILVRIEMTIRWDAMLLIDYHNGYG